MKYIYKYTKEDADLRTIKGFLYTSPLTIQTGIEVSEIKEFTKRNHDFILISVECMSLKEAAEIIRKELTGYTRELIISIKSKDPSFPIQDISPIVSLFSQFSYDAQSTWGISIDPTINNLFSVSLLVA